MADYKHGTYGEFAASIGDVATQAGTIAVYVGLAPVNLVRGFEQYVNSPVKLSNFNAVKRYFGYSPDTPFASVYEALRDLTDPATGVADRSKLALQISFGSAGFHVDGEDRLLETTIYHPAPSTLALRLAQPDTQVVYSEEFRNPCALYTTEDGSRYKVWYENEQSVLDKVALARMFGITGVSLWRIGNIPADGTYDVWSALLTQR